MTTKTKPTGRGAGAVGIKNYSAENSTAAHPFLIAHPARTMSGTGHFCTETARVQQQTDAEWIAEYDAADPLVQPQVSVATMAAGARHTLIEPAVAALAGKRAFSRPKDFGNAAGRRIHRLMWLGAVNREATGTAGSVCLHPAPPNYLDSHLAGFAVQPGTETMFVNDQTCPATGHTTTTTPTQTTGTPYTSLSFIKVEHKGPRKQRLTDWFAVPDQNYGDGNVTGNLVAAEFMAWLQTRPATFETGHVTREVMAAAVKALEEPFQHGKPNKRGAAVSFMAAMAGFIHFAARHSNHAVYLPAQVQQLKDWARETAEIEAERNRQTGLRLAAARKAKRAARQAECDAKAMKAGAA